MEEPENKSKADYFGVFIISCASWITATNIQLVYEIRRNHSLLKVNSLATQCNSTTSLMISPTWPLFLKTTFISLCLQKLLEN